jgi:hypothetical protein
MRGRGADALGRAAGDGSEILAAASEKEEQRDEEGGTGASHRRLI